MDDTLHFSDNDIRIMIEASEETHGKNDKVAVVKGVMEQMDYARLVSNL
jgi:hypothetical protein